MNLTEQEKQEIIELIQHGRPLPKEYIYKLYAEEEDVFLFWNGRREEVTNVALPFHSIEHIDEPRAEKPMEGAASKTNGKVFGPRKTNRLILPRFFTHMNSLVVILSW